jgi:hypothetical protein
MRAPSKKLTVIAQAGPWPLAFSFGHFVPLAIFKFDTKGLLVLFDFDSRISV